MNPIRDLYYLSTVFVFAVVNQVQTSSITVPADADFVMMTVNYTSSDNANPQTLTNGGGLLLLTDTGKQRQLMDNPIALDSIGGRGQLPGVLPMTHRFTRNGAVLVQLTNQGLATQTVRIMLGGYKVWAGAGE